MGRKAILEITSEKKQDTMVGLNQNQSGGPVPAFEVDFGFEGTVEDPQTLSMMLWCPTSRAKAGRAQESKMARTADDCYYKGISEKIHISTSDSEPWQWRRIVFTKKNVFDADLLARSSYVKETEELEDIQLSTSAIPPNTSVVQQGLRRYSRNLDLLDGVERNYLVNEIVMGTFGVDWADIMIAPMNKYSIHVMSDVKRNLRSGNNAGIMKDYNMWIPLNKTMRYESGEAGSIDINTTFAGQDSPLDDVYVLDIFRKSQTPDSVTSTATMSSVAKVYWHQK